MSIVVPDHSDQVGSQVSLFSDSPPSPSSSDSQSILKNVTSIARGLFRRSSPKSKESANCNVTDPKEVHELLSVDDPIAVPNCNLGDPKAVTNFNVGNPKVVHKLTVEDPKVVHKPKVDDPNVVNNSNVGDPKVIPNSNVDDQIVDSDSMVVDENYVPTSTGESDVANSSEALDLNVVSQPDAPLSNSDISQYSSPSSPPSASDPPEDDISDFTDESSNSSPGGPRTSLPPLRVSRSSSPVRADGRSHSPIMASAKHRMPPVVEAIPKKSR